MRFLHHIRQHIHKTKYRKLCRFGHHTTVDSNCQFSGNNRIGNYSDFLNSTLGEFSYIGDKCFIKNTVIGKYTCIANGVVTVSGTHPTDFVSVHPCFYSATRKPSYVQKSRFQEFGYLDPETKKSVYIGNDVWIGYGVTILEGVTIGDGAVIGACTLVNKDVPPYAIAGGVPFHIIRYRFDNDTVNQLLALKWWDKDNQWLINHAEYFDNSNRLFEQIKTENNG